jgi:hypothetical protein
VIRRASLLLGVLLVGGCHRKPAEVPADAAADAQARTSAKALSDIAAAEQAARTPLPAGQRAAKVGSPRADAPPATATADDGETELALNETADR